MPKFDAMSDTPQPIGPGDSPTFAKVTAAAFASGTTDGKTEDVTINVPGVGAYQLQFVNGLYAGYTFMPAPP